MSLHTITEGPKTPAPPENVIGTHHYDRMAQPAEFAAAAPSVELSLLEARTRLTHLVRVAATTGQSFVIIDRGEPAAVLMPPVKPQRGPGRDQEADDRAQAVAAGWQRRIEQIRAALISQHSAELSVARTALAEAWTLIDHIYPRGANPGVDRLRTSHDGLMPHPTT